MKTAIKLFWRFGRFRIQDGKKQNSDFQSHFSITKFNQILLNFFSLKNIKMEINFCYFHNLITLIFNVVVFLKEGPIFDLQF